MKQSTIQVSRELRTKLMKDKYKLNLDSAESVIWRLYKIATKIKEVTK